MLYVNNLEIQQVNQLTDIPLPSVLAAVFVAGVIAMVFASFSKGWLGISASFLFIALGIGIAGYTALNFKSVSENTSIDDKNAAAVQEWAADKYGVALEPVQAKALVGTASSTKPDSGKSLQYGRTSVTPTPIEGEESEPVEATLINDKGTWKLGSVKDDNSWFELRKPE